MSPNFPPSAGRGCLGIFGHGPVLLSVLAGQLDSYLESDLTPEQKHLCIGQNTHLKSPSRVSLDDFIVFICRISFYCFPFLQTCKLSSMLVQVCQSSHSHLLHTNPFLLLVHCHHVGKIRRFGPPLVPQGHLWLSSLNLSLIHTQTQYTFIAL